MQKYRLYQKALLSLLLVTSAQSIAENSDQISTRVVGGTDSNSTDYPWMVSLKYDGSHFCGGTLINKQWVLTAAHCVVDIASSDSNLTATVGEYDLSSDPVTAVSSVQTIIVHPDFNDTTYDNDLALIKLSSTVTTDPLNLLSSEETAEAILVDGTNSTVIGWGSTIAYSLTDKSREVNYPDILQTADLPLLSAATCKSLISSATDNMVCAGDIDNGGLDSCQGDSGGPLLVNSGTEQIGIVSFGQGCAATGKAGFYTKVANYLTWIDTYVNGLASISETNYFVAAVGQTKSFTVTMQNASEHTIPPDFTLSDSNVFTLDSDDCNEIKANATCELTIKYSPTTYGTDTATISINSNIDDVTSQSITLTGKSMKAVTADTLTFTENNDVQWYQSNTKPWLVSSESNYLYSPAISNQSTTQVTAIVSGELTLKFNWAVSSESDYDYLKLFINGVQQNSISGTQQFAAKSYAVSGENTVITWLYSKDSTNAEGLDRAFLHNVRFLNSDDQDVDTVPPQLDLANTKVSSNGGGGGGSLSWYSLLLLILLACYKNRLSVIQVMKSK